MEAIDEQMSLPNPRKVLILLDNLFFAAKINQAARVSGVQPIYAKTAPQALTLALAEPPSQIIIDLDATGCGPMELISQLKASDRLKNIPVIGFVSHVNTGIQQRARSTGCDRVLARSTFDRTLVTILREG